MNKIYSRILWENSPSDRTPLNETNLNKMDLAIDNLDDRVVQMDVTKVNTEIANGLLKSWTLDETTGIITVEKLNGEQIIFDLNIEKIPVSFSLSEDGILTMITEDGTPFTANIGAMIPILTFADSDTIAVSVTGTGVNKTYSFSIKAGSVTEDKLQPNFLSSIKVQAENAGKSASDSSTYSKDSEAWAVGKRNGVDVPETDETYNNNAKYYMEQAKAASAEEMTGATAEKDGTSGIVPAPIAGQESYVLKGSGAWEPEKEILIDSELSKESENALQNKVIAEQIESLNKAIDDAKALRATLEAYGMVKLSDSAAVTDSTGLALPATEKNASLEGTLANMLSQLNTNLQWEKVSDSNNFQTPYKAFTEDSLNIKVYKSDKEAIVTFDGVSSSEFTDNYWLFTNLPIAICLIHSVVYVSNEDATIKQPYRAIISERNINLFWSGTIPSGYHICGTFYYPIA